MCYTKRSDTYTNDEEIINSLEEKGIRTVRFVPLKKNNNDNNNNDNKQENSSIDWDQRYSKG